MADEGTGEAVTKPLIERATPFLGFATPMIAMVTAMLYFSGITDRDIMLRRLGGLSAAHLSEPFQATLARGALPTLVALTIIGAVAAVVRRLGQGADKIKSSLDKEHPLAAQIERIVYQTQLYQYIFLTYAIAVSLVVAVSSGFIAGDIEADSFSAAIADGCRTCTRYTTNYHWIVGIVIAEDDKIMVIVTRDGLRQIATGDLKSAKRLNPPLPAPFALLR